MKIIKPPLTEYTDYYKQSKFNLIWNFASAILVMLIFVTLSNYYNDNYTIIPNISAIGICIIVLLILKKTKKYRVVSIIGTSSIFILISLTFFLQINVIHYTTPMWMLLNILLAFFYAWKNLGERVTYRPFCSYVFLLCFQLRIERRKFASF